MAGLLERILANSGAGYTPGAFAGFPAPVMPEDEWAKIEREAELARVAADRRNAAGMKRAPIVGGDPNTPDAQSPGVQFALGNMRPGIPFSTQAGMLPPITLGGEEAPTEPVPPEAVPMPRPRPEMTDEVGARARTGGGPSAPVQIAPPAAAAPSAAPQAGMIPAAQPSILDRISSTLGDNSNTLLALGAGFAGAPGWGQAISRASAAAIPARAADIKQSLERTSRSYGTKALIEAGVPTQQAIAAQADPELKKALIQNYIVDRAKKIVKIGTDQYGADIMAEHDPFTGALKPINAQELRDAQSGSAKTATSAADNDITGPDYLGVLQQRDPAYARQVESIVKGDMPFPTGKQAQTPLGRRIIQDVLQVEPGSTPADFTNRQATSKAYTSGLESRVTRSVNTTLHHAATLEKAIKDLNNFNTMPGVANTMRKYIAGNVSPEYQKARAAYETAVANFAKELDFVVSGGRPTVSGTKHQMEGFDPDASQNAQMEKLRTGIDLLKGRLDSHADGFAKAMKRRVDPVDFVDPANRALYQRMVVGHGGEAPAPGAGGTPAAAPKPGTYVWDPATQKLVPAK